MMRRLTILVLSTGVIAACADDPKSSNVAAGGRTTCAGDLYDACTSSDQCASGDCKLYQNRGVQICTQACSASEPCPDQDGQPVTCNNMGLCRPDAANACDLP